MLITWMKMPSSQHWRATFLGKVWKCVHPDVCVRAHVLSVVAGKNILKSLEVKRVVKQCAFISILFFRKSAFTRVV